MNATCPECGTNREVKKDVVKCTCHKCGYYPIVPEKEPKRQEYEKSQNKNKDVQSSKKHQNSEKKPFHKTNTGIITIIASCCCGVCVLLIVFGGVLFTPDSTFDIENSTDNTINSNNSPFNDTINVNQNNDSSSSSDMDIGYYSADSALSQFDSNGDGKISWSEWVAWCKYDEYTYGYTYNNYARSDFINYDSNGDGYLDRTELANYFVGPHEFYY